jgi:Prokaryotic Cytochrome C oxidase subunit IV
MTRVAYVWLLLLLATGAAVGLRFEELGAIGGAATLALAYWKGRLVVLEYMELRHAPLVWRATVEGWLGLVTVAILGVYCLG